MNLDKVLETHYPKLNPLERRFVRFQGAMAKAWGSNRYYRLSYMFSLEFPGGDQTAALMHRIADILLGKEPKSC